jgi:hypothetical protein
MIKKKILVPDRVRRIKGSFCFIPHRFLNGGFLASLTRHELLLYLFLALAGDKSGLSYYSEKSICSSVRLTPDEYEDARQRLIARDLIAFDGIIFQVLELPDKPVTVLHKAPGSIADLLKKVGKEM